MSYTGESILLDGDTHSLQNNNNNNNNEDVKMANNVLLPNERAIIKQALSVDKTTSMPASKLHNLATKDLLICQQSQSSANAQLHSAAHTSKVYQTALKLVNKSIAYAPNALELGLCYARKSEMLRAIGEYEACIETCDRALALATPSYTELDLLDRKIACSELSKKITKDEPRRRDIRNRIETFQRNPEAPAASEALSIEYEPRFGRHVVAKRDVEPGEILMLEATSYHYSLKSSVYLCCDYCAKTAWTAVPCPGCPLYVYCSDACELRARMTYHRYECAVGIETYFSDFITRDEDFLTFRAALKFALKAVHEFEDVETLERELMAVEQCDDLRTKGFNEGGFESDSFRSMYSLTHDDVCTTSPRQEALIKFIAKALHCLSVRTSFFDQQRFTTTTQKLAEDENVIFMGALILRIDRINRRNRYEAAEDTLQREYLPAHFSLFNHSCNPNAEFSLIRNEETVIYATKPIKKGSQVFISYVKNTYSEWPIDDRKEFCAKYGFRCGCMACLENRSSICLPNLEALTNFTPSLKRALDLVNSRIPDLVACKSLSDVFYSDELMEQVQYALHRIARLFTEHCEEYLFYEKCLRLLITDYFEVCNL